MPACCRTLGLHVSITVQVSVWALGILISAEKKLYHWDTSPALLVFLKHVMVGAHDGYPSLVWTMRTYSLCWTVSWYLGFYFPHLPVAFSPPGINFLLWFLTFTYEREHAFVPSAHVWWDAIPIHFVETCYQKSFLLLFLLLFFLLLFFFPTSFLRAPKRYWIRNCLIYCMSERH